LRIGIFDISEQRNISHELALAQLEKLKHQPLLHQSMQDYEELHGWLHEKDVLSRRDSI